MQVKNIIKGGVVMKKAYVCQIIEKEVLSKEVFKLTFSKPPEMKAIKPGQFFNLAVSDNGFPLLRRPISVSLVSDHTFELTIKILGQGTKLLFDKQVGDKIDLMGPLGNGFFLENIREESIIVGGGIGISPMKELTRVLKVEHDFEPPVILGFREKAFDLDSFSEYSSKIEVATESGNEGIKGFVTPLLENHLKLGNTKMVYVCGPHAMLKAVNEVCKKYHVESQLLMEERMACGIGACLVCTCAIKEQNTIENKRVCKDGPVFYGSEVVFNV
jgi:dihydroorotate dehydrogenase electron transfer subunit